MTATAEQSGTSGFTAAGTAQSSAGSWHVSTTQAAGAFARRGYM